MMKKLLISLLAICAVSLGASAQKTELLASYGGYTQMDACNNHDSWHGVNNAWGAVTFGINFKVAPKFWVGPSYTFSSTSTKGGNPKCNFAYHGILLNGRYEYWRNSIVTLYGHLGIGAVVTHISPREYDAYNKGYFAMQISPVGAEVGINRDFSMFGELGFGAQGLLQVGFKLKL